MLCAALLIKLNKEEIKLDTMRVAAITNDIPKVITAKEYLKGFE